MPTTITETKHLSNSEQVQRFMDFGSQMNQIFVMNAISQAAEKVLKNKRKLRAAMKDGFINPDAWIDSAERWVAWQRRMFTKSQRSRLEKKVKELRFNHAVHQTLNPA